MHVFYQHVSVRQWHPSQGATVSSIRGRVLHLVVSEQGYDPWGNISISLYKCLDKMSEEWGDQPNPGTSEVWYKFCMSDMCLCIWIISMWCVNETFTYSDTWYLLHCELYIRVLCVMCRFPHWASSSPPHSALSFVVQVPGGGSADFPETLEFLCQAS